MSRTMSGISSSGDGDVTQQIHLTPTDPAQDSQQLKQTMNL